MTTSFKSLNPFAPSIDQGLLDNSENGPSYGGWLGTIDGSGTPDGSVGGSVDGSFNGASGVTGDLGSSISGLVGGILSSAAPAPTTVTSSTSPFQIHITWDSSVASAPAAFTTAVIAAAQYLESEFTNAVTINIDVGYGEVGGSSLGSGALGESESYLQSVSYASLLSALASHNTDATTASVLASLPKTAPVSGMIWVTTAEAKALGLTSANNSAVDGDVGFSSTYGFSYNSSSVASGTYDFTGVALHEMTEVMGRIMLTGGTIGSYRNSYSLLDLLHYSAPGVRDLSASTAGYFSANGGTTNGGTFNTVAGGDAADWASSMGNNSFDAFSNSGVSNPITSGDLTEMNAIGWTLATGSTTPTTPTVPTTPAPSPSPTPVVSPPGAVVIAPDTATLAAAQGASGLTANTALATLTSAGGVAGDPVTFALGGSGASAFTLTTANDIGTLSTGNAGVAGATNGKLYALTLTATDTSTSLSSTASTFDVVVAGSGNDRVSVETLVGAASRATPTFIYGLAGNDTLNGSDMTGKLWFDGGAGADTMTGGSGVNTYLYGATSDSTPTAMDIITNFNANKDIINLTGIGSEALTFDGSLNGNKLAADSIGYQISGFNTFVYVNTSGASEALTGTNMKIELNGWVPLGAGNIVHS